MEDDSSKRGVVIKGPWKDFKDKNKKPQKVEDTEFVEKDLNVREDLDFISKVHEVLLHQLIFTLNESGFDIKCEEFIKESGFIGECIRGLMMRDLGYSNPMSKFMNKVVDIDNKDGVKYANFDSSDLMKLIEKKNDKKN